MDKENEIKGKLRDLFGMPPKVFPKLKYHLNYLYTNPKIRYASPEALHRIIIDIFVNDYYPVVSRNIRIDKYSQSIIMGGIAYNKNVPNKMPFLKLDTDDIDLKIYTTEINYLEKNEKALYRVLSIFRFTTIIICMYLKQILELIKKFSNSNSDNYKLDSKQHKSKKTYKGKHKPHTIKNKPHTIKNKQIKSKKHINIHMHKQKGGNNIADKSSKGILYDYNVLLLLKKKNERHVYELTHKLELSELSYSEIFNQIMETIDDADLLITNKIGYNIKYGDVIKPGKFRNITFSDTAVIYPNIEAPGFYSYYLLNNKKEIGKPIDKLINDKISIEKLMGTEICGNNCKYTSIDSLITDIALMLSYAELLAYEQDNKDGKILIPIAFIFKYYKYLIKFIRLFVIKKYNNNTLTDKFLDTAKRLWTYALTNLQIIKSPSNDTDELTLTYKKILNDFHQNLFINKSLLNDYPELTPIIEEYNSIVYYINNSRALFKEIDSKSKHTGETLESIVIQMADHELSKSKSRMESLIHNGGYSKTLSSSASSHSMLSSISKSKKKLTLYSDDNYNDFELDNPENKKITKKIIVNKIDKLLKDEITTMNTIKKHL